MLVKSALVGAAELRWCVVKVKISNSGGWNKEARAVCASRDYHMLEHDTTASRTARKSSYCDESSIPGKNMLQARQNGPSGQCIGCVLT